jgi:ATP-dependent Clp protease ATP-binding subunit ClpC
VGREEELGWILQVLGRRNSRNPVLVGEPGVGKRAIVRGLAERITGGGVPSYLSDATLVELDLPPWSAMGGREFENLHDVLLKAAEGGAILVVDELHAMMDGALGGSSAPLREILKRIVVSGQLQVISIATPAAYARAVADHGWLESCFHAIRVAPASREETVHVLRSLKSEFEEFHGVTYLDEAVESCIACATACLPGRRLPGSAVDVMDEAGASVKLERGRVPEEVVEIQKRVQLIVRRLEASILNHEFEKARFYSDEERTERAGLRALREKLRAAEPTAVPSVTTTDVEKAVSKWIGISAETVRKMLQGS